MTRKKLGDLVVELGHVTEQQLDTALAYQRATGKPLGEVLLVLGIATEQQLAQALAVQQSVDAWDLKKYPPEKDAVRYVPADVCLKHLLIPVKLEDQTLTVAMRNPGDLSAVDRVYALTKLKIDPVQASDSQLATTLKELFGNDPTLKNSLDEFVTKALANIDTEAEVQKTLASITEEETRPVIGLVDQVIAQAVEMRASDIHIEPQEDLAVIRFRVDGRMMRVREIPTSLHRMVVARIKIMAELDIANHRHPQDGRVEFENDTKCLDLRVSVLPTHYGSRVVIRLLDHAAAFNTLDHLGFNPENAEIFRDIITKPYGIILVTGPTGSGKTTTLYAALNELRDEATNIMTCEDPIEYDLKGVNQSQVNEKAGLTFASQLRAILRQDPDVILVGEIRDKETAETAVRAALTGHLVFTTLHCNDAASAIPRLIDMGIDPYLLSTTTIGIVAQRLVRRLCKDCKKKKAPTAAENELFATHGFSKVSEIYGPGGCPKCHGTGYSGRFAIHEVLPVAEDVAVLIAARSGTEAIRNAATSYGFLTIGHDAVERVAMGHTSFEEVRRMVFVDKFKQKRPALSLAS